jgi:hypothetical protein
VFLDADRHCLALTTPRAPKGRSTRKSKRNGTLQPTLTNGNSVAASAQVNKPTLSHTRHKKAFNKDKVRREVCI